MQIVEFEELSSLNFLIIYPFFVKMFYNRIMDYLYKEKAIYLRYPIFQISYILLWIPLGFIMSSFLAICLIKIVYFIFGALFRNLFIISFTMYEISGRWYATAVGFLPFVVVAFDLVMLILGLELISAFLNKKLQEEHFNE